MPTVSVENYLKAIHHLQGRDEDKRVKTKEIAEVLEVSLPSVTSMLQSLASEELVDYRPYKGARLTDEGTQAALKVIRKHRLVEMFLVETLGYQWDEVHAEAEQLEHAISDTLAGRIDDFLGNPQFDPHGDPIPTADGKVVHRDSIPLHEVVPNMSVRVSRVLDQTPDVLRHLTTLGLTPGTVVDVVEVFPFDGQMSLEVEGAGVTISRSLASRLLVSEL